jgi:thiol-disulfide isomerase/thioredoxin
MKSLADYRNSVLVVNFWATWCAPCVQEMPELSALQTELSSKKIQFIGIGIDSQDSMTEFAQKYKITYPLLVGGMSGTQLASSLGNKKSGLPFTVLLNKSGEIVKTYSGRLDIKQLHQDILAVK